jgi:hypothetical protein
MCPDTIQGPHSRITIEGIKDGFIRVTQDGGNIYLSVI